MRHLHTFKVFEGKIFEGGKGPYFKFSLPLPTTQEEVEEINNYPEFQTLRKALSARGYIFPPNTKLGFELKPRGGLVLTLRNGADFKYAAGILQYEIVLAKTGTLYYGSYPVGPSTEFKVENWHQLIDFITMYFISKAVGITVNNIDKFVFDGKQISPSTLKHLERGGYAEIVEKMAKKYNSPEEMEAILSTTKQKSDALISDLSLLKNTGAFQRVDSIFGLKDSESGRHLKKSNCLSLSSKFFSPYGIFDPITRGTHNFYLCLGPTGDIRVKTLKGLENAVTNYFKKAIHAWYSREGISRLNAEMTEFVASQIGQPLSKESLIERFRPQIEKAMAQTFEEIMTQSPLNTGRLVEFLHIARNNFGLDFENPRRIINALEGDPLKIALIYDKLSPHTAEEIFKIMGTSREHMEAIKNVNDLGII